MSSFSLSIYPSRSLSLLVKLRTHFSWQSMCAQQPPGQTCVRACKSFKAHISVSVSFRLSVLICLGVNLFVCEYVCMGVCVCVYVQYHFPTRFLVNVGWWRQSTKLSNGELILALPPSLCAFHLLLTLAHSHPSQPMSYTASAPFLSIFVQIVRKKLTKHIGACTCVHLHWDFKKVKFFNRYIG